MLLPEFVSVWAMEVPDPAEYPLTVPDEAEAVQVKVVPGTVERTWILVVCCEQMVCAVGLKKTSGLGTTVTV